MAIDIDNTKPMPPDAKKVFQGNFYSIWQWQQTLFDGTTATFERLQRRNYAALIGVLPDKKILLIEDEQPDRGPVITPAGGGVEDGEELQAAAEREFREETGYEASNVVSWFSYRPNNRIDMICEIFIARTITKVGEPILEGGERVKLLTYTFDKFLELGHNDHLRDLLVRVKLLEAKLDPRKRAALEQIFYG